MEEEREEEAERKERMMSLLPNIRRPKKELFDELVRIWIRTPVRGWGNKCNFGILQV